MVLLKENGCDTTSSKLTGLGKVDHSGLEDTGTVKYFLSIVLLKASITLKA